MSRRGWGSSSREDDMSLGSAKRNWELTLPADYHEQSRTTSSTASAQQQPPPGATVTDGATTVSSYSSASWGTPVSEEMLKKNKATSPLPNPMSIAVHDRMEASTVSGVSSMQIPISSTPSVVNMTDASAVSSISRPRSDKIPSSGSSGVSIAYAHLPPPPPPRQMQPPANPYPVSSISSNYQSHGGNSSHAPSPYAPRPYFPHKTTEVPKAALHALYGKAERRKALAATDYYTWHDSGPPHALHWSSCFVCPITAEVFVTRPYEASKERPRDERGLLWYKKKTNAEHGAAACAYDCWSYRDFTFDRPGIPPFTTLLDKEAGELPYTVDRAITIMLPEGVPDDIRQKVQQHRLEILQRNGLAMQVDDAHSNPPVEEVPEEMAWEKRPHDNTAYGVFDDP